MKERREKGLCYNCDEKFRPGHKCKSLTLFLIDGNDLLIAMLFHIQRYLFMPLQVLRTPRLCVSLVIITISLFTYSWTLALLITSWILQLHQSSIFLYLVRPLLMSWWLMEIAYIVRDNVKIYLLTSKEFQLPQIFTSFPSGDMMLFWVHIGSRPSVPFYGISPN
jgi:hypothetical protein